jgi:hypothetical protein
MVTEFVEWYAEVLLALFSSVVSKCSNIAFPEDGVAYSETRRELCET